jgi:hypothetical protein
MLQNVAAQNVDPDRADEAIASPQNSYPFFAASG